MKCRKARLRKRGRCLDEVSALIFFQKNSVWHLFTADLSWQSYNLVYLGRARAVVLTLITSSDSQTV